MGGARTQRGFRILSRAKLYLLRAGFARRLNLLRVRVYEEARDDAAFAQAMNSGAYK
jgi:hypothetical protein